LETIRGSEKKETAPESRNSGGVFKYREVEKARAVNRAWEERRGLGERGRARTNSQSFGDIQKKKKGLAKVVKRRKGFLEESPMQALAERRGKERKILLDRCSASNEGALEAMSDQSL